MPIEAEALLAVVALTVSSVGLGYAAFVLLCAAYERRDEQEDE